MAALTKGRNTARSQGDLRQGAVAASTRIFPGAIVMRNATGYLVQGQTALNLVGVGRAEAEADNSAGADGAVNLVFQPGTYLFENSAAADEITIADIGSLCYVVDDQTVARTNGTNTRSPAGIVDDVDANGVWVRFDAALTSAT